VYGHSVSQQPQGLGIDKQRRFREEEAASVYGYSMSKQLGAYQEGRHVLLARLLFLDGHALHAGTPPHVKRLVR